MPKRGALISVEERAGPDKLVFGLDEGQSDTIEIEVSASALEAIELPEIGESLLLHAQEGCDCGSFVATKSEAPEWVFAAFSGGGSSWFGDTAVVRDAEDGARCRTSSAEKSVGELELGDVGGAALASQNDVIDTDWTFDGASREIRVQTFSLYSQIDYVTGALDAATAYSAALIGKPKDP